MMMGERISRILKKKPLILSMRNSRKKKSMLAAITRKAVRPM